MTIKTLLIELHIVKQFDEIDNYEKVQKMEIMISIQVDVLKVISVAIQIILKGKPKSSI